MTEFRVIERSLGNNEGGEYLGDKQLLDAKKGGLDLGSREGLGGTS